MITRAWSLPRYDFKASEPNIEKQYFLRSGDVRGKLILYEMLVGLLFHYLHTHYHSPTFYAANSLFSSAWYYHITFFSYAQFRDQNLNIPRVPLSFKSLNVQAPHIISLTWPNIYRSSFPPARRVFQEQTKDYDKGHENGRKVCARIRAPKCQVSLSLGVLNHAFYNPLIIIWFVIFLQVESAFPCHK